MGPYLSSPVTKKKCAFSENERAKIYACEMQGWRNSMEDATMLEENLRESLMIFGVFDGHGGKEVAHFVARHFNNELSNCRPFLNGNYEHGLKETFLRMDEMMKSPDGIKELLRTSRDLPESHPVFCELSSIVSGCTTVITLISKDALYVANVGDPKCILSRNCVAKELTTNHTLTLPGERERIIKAGGQILRNRVMGKLNFTRSIGDFEYKKNNSIAPKEQIISAYPDIKIEPLLGNEDFLILGSDGVFDMVSPQACVNFIHEQLAGGENPELVLENLLNQCLAADPSSNEGLGCDNMAIILVEFKLRA